MDKSDPLEKRTKQVAELRRKNYQRKKKRAKDRGRRLGRIERLQSAVTLKANEANCLRSTNVSLKQRLNKAISEHKQVKWLAIFLFSVLVCLTVCCC